MECSCRCWGRLVHDWGLGIGTFLFGAGAIIAGVQTNVILEKILGVQSTVAQIKSADCNLQQAVGDIKRIVLDIDTAFRRTVAQNAVARTPSTAQEIKNVLLQLVRPEESACPSTGPYLPEKLLDKVQKEWTKEPDPKKREDSLFNALHVCPPVNQSCKSCNK